MTLNGEGGTDAADLRGRRRAAPAVTDKDYTFSGGVLSYFENGFVAAVYELRRRVRHSQLRAVRQPLQRRLDRGWGDAHPQRRRRHRPHFASRPLRHPYYFVLQRPGRRRHHHIDDTADTVADTYFLTKTLFDKTGFSLLTFDTTETLPLRFFPRPTRSASTASPPGRATISRAAPRRFLVARRRPRQQHFRHAGTRRRTGRRPGDLHDTADTANDTYRLDNGAVTKANVPAQTMSTASSSTSS